MSRIRGPYVRFCERDEAVTPHPTRCVCYLQLLLTGSRKAFEPTGELSWQRRLKPISSFRLLPARPTRVPQLVLHWVSVVLTSWNSVRRSTPRLRAWNLVCRFRLLSLYTATAASRSSPRLRLRRFC